jgi:hypothetical protein
MRSSDASDQSLLDHYLLLLGFYLPLFHLRLGSYHDIRDRWIPEHSANFKIKWSRVGPDSNTEWNVGLKMNQLPPEYN